MKKKMVERLWHAKKGSEDSKKDENNFLSSYEWAYIGQTISFLHKNRIKITNLETDRCIEALESELEEKLGISTSEIAVNCGCKSGKFYDWNDILQDGSNGSRRCWFHTGYKGLYNENENKDVGKTTDTEGNLKCENEKGNDVSCVRMGKGDFKNETKFEEKYFRDGSEYVKNIN